MTSVPDRHGVLRDALSQLHFDDLVDELQSRLQAVLRTHNRVDRLLQAVHAVASDLEREQVLHRIVDAAMNLVRTRSTAHWGCSVSTADYRSSWRSGSMTKRGS